ncbi:thioredoxin [Caballeronia terrestris]|uniref:Thioredoxin n=1 Tax=Caballeronia terrestris TaxID=1226301 RepID=A0A158JSQ7_9BURK|nr:thioredoxin [Caballeronia terrestris]SAL71808.1 thioredoxin [Caballeronia terrestris]
MDTTIATFENDVINASMLAPVLVDFWAPWCGPCKTLGPMLERLEAEAAGKWKLVKVNVDENQELAQHFQVRSIPHVIAFADGQAVDQFIGVLSEGQLREFLDKLVPDGADAERRAAHAAWEAGNKAEAIDLLKTALAIDPGFDEARLDLIGWLLAEQRIDEAREEDKLLSPKTTQGIDARYNALKTELDAADAAADLPPADALIDAVNQKPDDLEARFALANRLIAGRDYAGALEHLLAIVVRDRSFMDDVGRKTMLSVFELAAHQPEVVSQWRRKLSAAMN